MTQDKTLRELFIDKVKNKDFSIYVFGLKEEYYDFPKIADFYEDKIKSVVSEIRKEASHNTNKALDDLLERLGIK